MCADAFNKFLPFCTGFAAGCMIWMVVAEVLPDAFKVTYLTDLCGIFRFMLLLLLASSFQYPNTLIKGYLLLIPVNFLNLTIWSAFFFFPGN